MVKWTNEQRSAFESRNQNLLLSAAAGSGKTAVLVQRIVSLIIDDKVPINKMLIITFTKAAAGEMRERILEALSELMNEKDIDKSFIRKQITMINNSNISTIHAFCMEVIKRNFHNIDIDPSFRILDMTEKELLFIESINEVLEIEYEIGQSEFITLVESYTSNRNDEKLILIIESIYKFIRSKPHPFDWLEEKVELYNIDKDNIDDHIWVKALKKIIIKELKISKKYLDEAMIISEEINGPLEYGKTIKSDLEIIYNLKELINNDVSMFYNEINNISYQRLASIPKKRKEEIDPELIKLAKQLRDNSKKTIKKLSDKIGLKSFNQQIGDTNKLYATIKYLVGIIKKVDIQFRDKKLEKNSVDFNDLEQFALELLRDNNISNKYREKFDYIFVDEYQDTNIIQEEIVNLIKRDNNVFLVGDVKQSIYKFRLAEPELFLSKYESFSISEKADNRRINLSKNFRTRVEILDGINYIFKDLMTKEFGEIEYNKDAYLYKGMEFENINNPNVEINIINIDKKSASIEEVDQELLDLKTSEIEAKAVIQRIRALIDTETYDKKLKKIRKIEYRDIVILMRATSNWGPIYEEVFMREGIPLYYEGGTGYLQTLEIEIFLNLLKVIDNKRNDVSLLSVMRSPIGEFSINEMIEIRLEFPNKNYFDSLNEISKNDSKLGIKANLFIKKLNEWYKISKYLEIDEFIEKLLFDTNFINYVSAMPGGNIRRGNLKLLINKAKVFSESSITGLFYFIKFIQRIDNINVDFDTANVISENENVVRLMSIHKSKGLEFPVVIIARSNRQMVSQESKNDFVMHKDYGVGANYIDYEKRMKSDTISRWVINKKKNEENLAEEMRILYVAMTRSIDRLILFGTYSKGFLKSIDEWTLKNSKEFLDTSKSYIDWIMKIISRNKGCKTIYEIADKEENCDENDLFTVNVIELKDIE
ncbi:MAG: helicase-exonuclease AddAB subunit AddA, partial [Bacillota bacterium]|nr:helicase-exonuclease AddAB subunit AddA [Bacillota bacterium]